MFRIKKYHKGYVCEIQKMTWYGKKYWVHYGAQIYPVFHETYDNAADIFSMKIRMQLKEDKIYAKA